MQDFQLLRQRHFEEAEVDRGLILSAKRQQSGQARRRDAVGQGDAQLTVEAIDTAFTLSRACARR